ncbi:hypothetical protein G9A89_014969 [Geosiphon pyriformis]|nr:hypothetical protein G9A89_014969 [Geosiphon pyriformis]
MIAERRAIPFTALATAPTVTLPRIKALTTGAIPNFLDAILNIAESDTSSSLAHQDNWLIQMKRTANMNISFFGDDTWIKLFPNIFHTTDGTTSFVTADTVEVDLNVTRHVLPELKKPHWDVLIFHYLGLDHIGHSSGPHSPMMKPKQIEMDDIVKTIFETISEQDNKRAITDSNSKPTLFVLCGDHGMNELGNHGGASKGEISTAIVFMSSAFGNFTRSPKTYETPHNVGSLSFYDLINQIDLVPTICFLFGIPIPKNNLGKIVLQVGDLDGITSLRALQLNARQIAVILQTLWTSFNINFHKSDLSHISDIACDSIVEEKNRLQCLYDQAHQLHAKAYYTGSAEIIERSLYLYEKFIDEASSRISSSSREYGLGSMYCGIIVITFATCWFIALLIDQYKSGESETVALRIHRFWTRERSLGFFGAIGLSVTMFASSYIEEEHQFWYFWMQTLWIGFLVKSNAYIGIRNYNVVWVGVLTFLANWAGPIWWAVASNLIRQEIINPRNLEASGQILFKGTQYCSINFKQPKPPLFLDYILYTSTFHAIVLLILSIAMMIFRNHLFVWTVFSPKYLYQIVWNILHHFGIEVVVCGLLDWVEQ